MGEAAATMVANVDYELPYIRKQTARCALGCMRLCVCVCACACTHA